MHILTVYSLCTIITRVLFLFLLLFHTYTIDKEKISYLKNGRISPKVYSTIFSHDIIEGTWLPVDRSLRVSIITIELVMYLFYVI